MVAQPAETHSEPHWEQQEQQEQQSRYGRPDLKETGAGLPGTVLSQHSAADKY